MNKKQSTQFRFAILAKMDSKIFHTKDFANIWQISDNNLYTTLKRYTQKGLLYHIYKGLYSTVPISKLNPWFLGIKAIHKYAYISCEAILVQNGIIQQSLEKITIVSSQSKKFTINGYSYLSRQLVDRFLYQDIGIIKKDNINIATTERAVADLLYFNPNYYFDNKKNINWKKVNQIQKEIGYPIIKKWVFSQTCG